MGPLYSQQQFPMASLGPIILLCGAADALGWAHLILNCSCQGLRLGPLRFWEPLPMRYDGPIASLVAVADGFALAHYFAGQCCRCLLTSPLHSQLQLVIALLGPINYFSGGHCRYVRMGLLYLQ
jgi:hypothetical protein